MASTHLPEEGSVPWHSVTVTGVGSLDFRVERADHIIKQLDSDVIPLHAGARAPCVLISRLKDLKGAKPGGETQVLNRSDAPSPCEDKERKRLWETLRPTADSI